MAAARNRETFGHVMRLPEQGRHIAWANVVRLRAAGTLHGQIVFVVVVGFVVVVVVFVVVLVLVYYLVCVCVCACL